MMLKYYRQETSSTMEMPNFWLDSSVFIKTGVTLDIIKITLQRSHQEIVHLSHDSANLFSQNPTPPTLFLLGNLFHFFI